MNDCEEDTLRRYLFIDSYAKRGRESLRVFPSNRTLLEGDGYTVEFKNRTGRMLRRSVASKNEWKRCERNGGRKRHFRMRCRGGAQEKKRRNKLRDYGSASSRAFRAKLRARTLEFYVWRFAVEVCQLHPSLLR